MAFLDETGLTYFWSKIKEKINGKVDKTNNAGSHNGIYRGKNLGTSVTAEQYSAIADGTFNDLYIGDYWTIDRITYRIAAFDYYLYCSKPKTTKHHVLIVPDNHMDYGKMNTYNRTDGGYVGSVMYNENLSAAKTKIKAAFSGHVLNHRVYLVNAVSTGVPSAGAWYDSEVELMSEKMVYGCPIFEPMWGGAKETSVSICNYTLEKSQLPLFALNPAAINANNPGYWLRDVVDYASFACVGHYGEAQYADASSGRGVRPFFCIY